MGAMASQITSLTIVYSTVYSGADQRIHQSSASQTFVRGIHRWPVTSSHKWPVTWKIFPFDDVIITKITEFHMIKVTQSLVSRFDSNGQVSGFNPLLPRGQICAFRRFWQNYFCKFKRMYQYACFDINNDNNNNKKKKKNDIMIMILIMKMIMIMIMTMIMITIMIMMMAVVMMMI